MVERVYITNWMIIIKAIGDYNLKYYREISHYTSIDINSLSRYCNLISKKDLLIIDKKSVKHIVTLTEKGLKVYYCVKEINDMMHLSRIDKRMKDD